MIHCPSHTLFCQVGTKKNVLSVLAFSLSALYDFCTRVVLSSEIYCIIEKEIWNQLVDEGDKT